MVGARRVAARCAHAGRRGRFPRAASTIYAVFRPCYGITRWWSCREEEDDRGSKQECAGCHRPSPPFTTCFRQTPSCTWDKATKIILWPSTRARNGIRYHMHYSSLDRYTRKAYVHLISRQPGVRPSYRACAHTRQAHRV